MFRQFKEKNKNLLRLKLKSLTSTLAFWTAHSVSTLVDLNKSYNATTSLTHRVGYIVGSSPDLVKPKAIKLVVVASPPSTQL